MYLLIYTFLGYIHYIIYTNMQKSLVKAMPYALAYARDFFIIHITYPSTAYKSCLLF